MVDSIAVTRIHIFDGKAQLLMPIHDAVQAAIWSC